MDGAAPSAYLEIKMYACRMDLVPIAIFARETTWIITAIYKIIINS